jgi:hypothetical protein
MKKVLSFIKWQFARFDRIDCYIIFGMILIFSSPSNNKIILIMASIWLLFGIAYLTYILIRHSYNQFKTEQSQLLEKIKNSSK